MADAAPVAVDEADAKAVKPPSLATRLEWIHDWMTSTADARAMSSRDERYYYGKQWTADEIAVLNKRKQPVTVNNLIRKKVNSTRGEEIDKRVDPVAKPRSPKHEAEAPAITDALRYVEEDQDIDGIGGDLMLDLINAGICGAIVEVDEDDGYRVTVQHIPWAQIAVDPRSRRRDCSDAKWLANIQWIDLDDALDIYPNAEKALKNGCERHIVADDDATEDRPKKWFDSARKRVKVCELYYRSGRDWYRCDFTDGADLRECAPCSYIDPRTCRPGFAGRPWAPMVVGRCYVDDDNNTHGPVRDMISPQDAVNKRESKLLNVTNTKQVIYEEGAIPDITSFQLELAKPDGAPMVNTGALTEGRIQLNTAADMGVSQVQLLQEAKQSIDAIGPAAANIPDLPNSASGRSVAFRQKAASREMGPLFEIFAKIRTLIYWHCWGCIRQWWTDEMWLRVTDEEETVGYRWVGLNRRLTRGERLQELLQKGQPLPVALQNAAGEDAMAVMQYVQQAHQIMAQQAMMSGMPPPGGDQHMLQMVLSAPQMQAQIIENRVAEAMVDITIHEAPESAVLEDEEFSKLSEFAGMAVQLRPDLSPVLLRMLIKLSAFRDKREMLKEMEKPKDPQQAQMAQMAQQLQMAGAKAGIDVQKTQAQLNAARAAELQAKAPTYQPLAQADIEAKKAGAMHDAANAGEKMGAGFGMPGGI